MKRIFIYTLLSSLLAIAAQAQQGVEASPQVTANDTSALRMVDQMPEFPGNLMATLSNTLVYPSNARRKGITGRVVVEFVVDEAGDIRQAKVIQPVHPDLDAEALRVVNALPRWKPGQQDGRRVKVFFRLPINFQLK